MLLLEVTHEQHLLLLLHRRCGVSDAAAATTVEAVVVAVAGVDAWYAKGAAGESRHEHLWQSEPTHALQHADVAAHSGR